jgi:hypothetical protein
MAFDDQCTGGNPRYPLVGEIKQLFLDAYYGTGAGEAPRTAVSKSAAPKTGKGAGAGKK